jgi:type I restriction enzyme S subunit
VLLKADINTVTILGQKLWHSTNKERRGIPLLNGPEEFGSKYPTPKQYTEKPSKICDIGDILFCVRGATAGRMNWSDKNYCIGRGLAAIQSVPGKTEIRFLYQFLLMNYEKFQKTGRGSTFINISRADITNLKIPLPPLALQQQFARVVQDVERIRERQAESKREIYSLFDGLMAGAFAGDLVA